MEATVIRVGARSREGPREICPRRKAGIETSAIGRHGMLHRARIGPCHRTPFCDSYCAG